MNATYRFAALLILWACVKLFGENTLIGASMGLTVVLGLFLLGMIFDAYKRHRSNRKACESAIYYARKNRKVFDDPDYTDDELADMQSLSKKGRFKEVYAVILASNKRLIRAKSAAAHKDTDVSSREQRRIAELRLYTSS